MSGESSMLELFREEARAHAGTLGRGLVELESDPANPQRIEPLMRAAHSIKGAARIVGVEPAVQLAHVLEDVLVAAQTGRIRLAPASIDWLLRGTDLLASLAEVTGEDFTGWQAAHAAVSTEVQAALGAILQGRPQAAPVVPAAPAPAPTPPPAPTPIAQPAPAPAEPAALDLPARAWVEFPDTPIQPESGDPTMLDLLREEVRRHGRVLQHGLLELASDPTRRDRIEPWFEGLRQMRSASRIVGIAPLDRLLDHVAAALQGLRDGRIPLTAATLDTLLHGSEDLARFLAIDEETVAHWSADHADAVAALAPVAPSVSPVSPEPVPAPPAEPVLAVEPANPPVPAVEPAASRPAAPASPAAAPPPADAEAVVRVTAQSLNRLMNLAGESLVQARWLQPFSTALLKLKKHQDLLAGLLDQFAQAVREARGGESVGGMIEEARRQSAVCRQVLAERTSEFEDHAAQAEDLNTRLYREVIVSRMRPFADGAHGLPRLVRDMARQLGKNVRLEIEGAGTEVDRDVLDKLEAPLTHMLRNAVDHGIEMPEARAAAGKPETAIIRLDVRHRAGMLAITVSDDGRGIDLDKLRGRIVERGLSTPELVAGMTEAELLEFLFLPGFSTAAKVTEYSGRGVGLDVVLDSVRKIGGSVRITSQPGRGTSFHLQLPVTLSVLRAVLVDIAGEPYAFPHNRIDRLLRVPASALRSVEHRQFVTVDGQNIGLVLASQLLELPAGAPPGDELPVVLLSDASGTYGLVVDAFRGEQDLVVRPLDPRLGKVPNLSAAAILDDGAPVLIADVEDLIRSMDQYIQGGTLLRCEKKEGQVAAHKRILVVEDSITVREVERQTLLHHGYDVAVAVDGADGWNRVRAERFDLVVTDVDMPRMTGLQLVEAIRDHQATRHLPVIIISYKEREEDRLRGLQAGANYYLTKSSFHDNRFIEAVVNLIGPA